MTKIVAIVQARMGSTRLPGKVLKEVLSRPLLSYQIERMAQSRLIDELVIATTPNSNEPIIELCKKENVSYFIGSEKDVLERYYLAAKQHQADIVVRMTSDCPLIDADIVDNVINMYKNNNFDYVSNTQIRTFPRGMDTEVFSFSALERAYKEAKIEYEHEHVTPYLYLNAEKFKIGQYIQDQDFNEIRLTVDTPEDSELIKRLFEKLYPINSKFSLEDILEVLKENPSWLEINKEIVQKKLGE